ncbi:MAG: M48 family metallopeptidase [Campylobacteraceae bacterium]|nr:M48 family metallopeptidase [Campylobacteraceae bacterium]
MLELITLFYILYIVIKMYASVMEIGFVMKAAQLNPIILSASNYLKAASYKIASQKLSLMTSLYDFFLFFIWITFGLSFLETMVTVENEILHSVVYVMGFIAINYLLGLPFDVYQTFWLDKKFGFSTIDVKMFVMDQVKASLMFLILGSALLWVLVWIIGSFEQWWIFGFGFIFAVILFINMIYPIFIVPIFNKLTPLEDENLKTSIETLLQKAGLKSSGVFSLDASKRDKRLNAYFGGLGSSKRVVLFDTLIEKLNKSELLAVLGHELGHFKHKDIFKNIASSGLMLFIMFALFGNLPTTIFTQLGVNGGAHIVIVLFLLFSPLVAFVLMPFFGLLSRYNEYRADEYGSACESKEALVQALVKLADENKSFPLSHPLTIMLYFTHPPLSERLRKLGMDIPHHKA